MTDKVLNGNRPLLAALAVASGLLGGAGGWVAKAPPPATITADVVREIVDAERDSLARLESHLDDAIGQIRDQLRGIDARISIIDQRLHDHINEHRRTPPTR